MTRPDPSLLEDLLQFGERAFSALLGVRHEAGAQARSRLEGLARRLDLVGREEFDAAFAMIARARAVQEETLERLARIEKHLGLAPLNLAASAPSSRQETKSPRGNKTERNAPRPKEPSSGPSTTLRQRATGKTRPSKKKGAT